MDESKLELEDMSIGSMAGVLSDLNQNESQILKNLPLQELEQQVIEFRKIKLHLHQIQKYKFNFNSPTLQNIVDLISQKQQLSKEIIEKEKIINQQFLLEYHKYEKSIIQKVQEGQKQTLEDFEELEDKITEWYKQITQQFNELTSLKLFQQDELNVIYNEELYTNLQNKENLVQFQQGLYKQCAQNIYDELQSNFNKYQFQHINELEGIQQNLQIMDQYYLQQQYIDDLIDFLSSKLIFEITQIVKNSLINIDKITDYINKQQNKLLNRQQNKEYKQYESKEQQTLFMNMLHQIKYFKHPKSLAEHNILDESINNLNKQLHQIILKNPESSDYPKGIQKKLKKLHDYFFKGNRKFIKLKIRYLKIAQQFEDTLDKQELLNQNVLAELQSLQSKSNILNNFMTGLFDLGEFCLSCYDFSEEVNSFLFQIQLLIHHYTESLRIIGASKSNNLGQRQRIRKIFEPYPEDEKVVLTKKYSLLQVNKTGSQKSLV